ncbi:GD10174 [Drosophila simulans]|uniref:GD10174 n=1 Tax=Drosophila simulans TaxID=7240 RepID=B4QFQ7_DROSI|nr:GD10174 [Drosophila simulans]
MPIFAKNLPCIRHLAKRTLFEGRRWISGLEKGQNSAAQNVNPCYNNWPMREESFAAAQQLRQRQQSRRWSNNYSGLDSAMFRPVAKPDEVVPRRNNVLAAQNAARRRNFKSAQVAQYQQRQEEEQRLGGEPEATAEEHDYESDLEVRSVRETVFGSPEDNSEEEMDRARAEQELLQRVADASKQAERLPESATISRKVISPYNSYRSHRTRWAEFRHSMIFGRTSY